MAPSSSAWTTVLVLAICASSTLAAPTKQQGKRATQSRPNIIFMMADQMRFDALGSSGVSKAKTPNLDRIANEGVNFRYGVSSIPTCTPARAAILTGQSPWNNGMIGYGIVSTHYPYEFPRIAAEAGYITATRGKDHFGWDPASNKGVPHGYNTTLLYDGSGTFDTSVRNNWIGEFDDYDQWFASQIDKMNPDATLYAYAGRHVMNTWKGHTYVFDEYYHPTAWLGRAAVDFIQNFNETDPYLLKVSFHRPHSPYDPPRRVFLNITDNELPAIHADVNWDQKFKKNQWCGPEFPDAWCGEMPPGEVANSRKCYYGSVKYVDEQVGLIYEALEKTGQLNNTYIFFTADHGDGQGDHFHWRKGFPYEFSMHVPLFMRWPDSEAARVNIPRGTVIDDKVVAVRDIFHTVVDIINATDTLDPNHFRPEDGKSILCLLQDPSGQNCSYAPNPGPWREYLDMEHACVYNHTVHWNALTDGKVKYIFHAYDASEQLFNLTADPYEMVDLSSNPNYTSVLEDWRGRLLKLFQSQERGSTYYNGTQLLSRTDECSAYSPNYPAPPEPLPGNQVVIDSITRPNDMWQLNINPQLNAGQFQVLNTTQPFCLQPESDDKGAQLLIQPCEETGAQYFAINNNLNGTYLLHLRSQLCLSSNQGVDYPGTLIILDECGKTNWVVRPSGQMCMKNPQSGCISVYVPLTKSLRWSNEHSRRRNNTTDTPSNNKNP
eukprot:m.285382 g.285382  ORF g.285382 m.285382 type:complete len:718 (+) comp15775_c2_seq4:31-2184(+)